MDQSAWNEAAPTSSPASIQGASPGTKVTGWGLPLEAGSEILSTALASHRPPSIGQTAPLHEGCTDKARPECASIERDDFEAAEECDDGKVVGKIAKIATCTGPTVSRELKSPAQSPMPKHPPGAVVSELGGAELDRLGVCEVGELSFAHLDGAEAEQLWQEVWERECYLQHGVTLRAGGLVVDVGANIGLFSLLALSRGAHVLAIEPLPPLATVLDANLQTWAQRESARPVSTSSDAQQGLDASAAAAAPGCLGRPAEAPAQKKRRVDTGEAAPDPSARFHVVQAGIGAEPAVDVPFVFFPDCPGESTRHPDERAEQRAALLRELTTCPLRVGEGTGEDASAAEVAAAVQAEVTRLEKEVAGGAGVGVGKQVLCPVITLRDALVQSGHEETPIDLLKIDAEGDELSVLEGLTDKDWASIRQLAVEVHDVDDRLATTRALLTAKGYTVATVLQQTGVVDGYLSVVPPALALHYVYATRV